MQREEIRKDYLDDILNETSNLDLNTDKENDEIEKLKIENQLLKQLVTELKDKNQILKDNINNNKNTHESIPKPTYKQILASESVKQKKIPKIIIKKKNKDDKIDLKKSVSHYLIKNKTVQTKKIYFKNENEAIIDCMNDNSAQIIEKSLSEKLSNSCSIEKEEIKKPKLKVVGVDNFEKMTLNELEADINKRNFTDSVSSCKVLHKYLNKKNNLESIIIEVSANMYKKIKENKDRMFIGYQNCKVYDEINLRPCYNCGRFGHSGSKCTNEKVCLKCSGSHNSINCPKNEKLCCINCLYHNNKYKANYDTNHVANDSYSCQVLKFKIKKHIETTDYPTIPTIQRYIGKIDINPTAITTTTVTSPTSLSRTKSRSILSINLTPTHNSK